jgi:hypothetical protein
MSLESSLRRQKKQTTKEEGKTAGFRLAKEEAAEDEQAAMTISSLFCNTTASSG